MDERKCCGTCKWHKSEGGVNPEWACFNEDSFYYTDYTEYGDVCPDWEARE